MGQHDTLDLACRVNPQRAPVLNGVGLHLRLLCFSTFIAFQARAEMPSDFVRNNP